MLLYNLTSAPTRARLMTALRQFLFNRFRPQFSAMEKFHQAAQLLLFSFRAHLRASVIQLALRVESTIAHGAKRLSSSFVLSLTLAHILLLSPLLCGEQPEARA